MEIRRRRIHDDVIVTSLRAQKSTDAPTLSEKAQQNKANLASEGVPTLSDAPALEVKVVCPRCGAWKRIPPDILMLTDPRCLVCGSVMRPAPEDDPPEGVPPPSPSESASPPDLPTQSD
jgi:rubredoxin